ncbi:aliphatic sulfonate ABC transporter substrate-binding protein [Bacillus sp. S3]|uniref:ABC transporter substrate-binding protein n=1 Tax=Bacillus sp. S3 TaxID=486398 RepID=UPI0011883027|nr:ABC transporter substrate-binding protein [Bacillus sp. S3]QCJ40635.1 aliphatic sulfonate ABC transporter substrate-binding protein [Bacillus sp. S3]
MKKLWIIVLLIVMVVATGCSNNTSGKEESKSGEKLSIAVSTWVGYAPLYIAKEKGIFKKNGINVELVKMESVSDRRSSMAANRIQGFATTVDSHVVTAASDLPVVQVVALDDSYGGDGIVANKQIKSLKDLVGKTVAVQTDGGASFFWFLYQLNQEGINFKDIKAQNMTAGDAGAAFVANKVDAAVTWEPWLSKAKETTFGSVLTSSDQTPGVIADTIGLRKDFVEKNPKVVKALVKSWYEALDYIQTDKEDAIGIMAKAMGQSNEELEESLNGVRFYDQEKNKEYFGTKENPGKLKELTNLSSKLWVELKLIDKEPNIDELIDYSFVQ